MQSKAKTVAEYLASLPADRRAAIEAVRQTILANLDADYEECMQYGMIGYVVPHRVFPAGYHCSPELPLPFAALASQKNYMSLYVFGMYAHDGSENPQGRWFRTAWTKTGKKLDMGKCCVRFKKLDDVPLEVVGEVFRRVPARVYVEYYSRALAATGRDTNAGGRARRASRVAAAGQAPTKATKKTTTKAAKSAAAKTAAKKSSKSVRRTSRTAATPVRKA